MSLLRRSKENELVNLQNGSSDDHRYSLELSDEELKRYRWMATTAVESEGEMWHAAGLQAGARVVEIGCGPGAMLRELAQIVGESGIAVGVDADPLAVSMAQQELRGFDHADVRLGLAAKSGLVPESFDVVMCRHVLAHNRKEEGERILAHLVSLLVPGGCLYLADVDYDAFRYSHSEPDLNDLEEHYIKFQRARGSNLSVGLQLGDLLRANGLEVERYICGGPVQQLPLGVRFPGWAAREAMMAEGFATPSDIERWNAAFVRQEALGQGPLFFPLGLCIAFGRRV